MTNTVIYNTIKVNIKVKLITLIKLSTISIITIPTLKSGNHICVPWLSKLLIQELSQP